MFGQILQCMRTLFVEFGFLTYVFNKAISGLPGENL